VQTGQECPTGTVDDYLIRVGETLAWVLDSG